MPNKSTCRTNPHAEQIHMPNKSTCRTNPHAEQIHMPNKSTCRTNPHAEQIHMPNKSTCRTNPHAEQIHMPNKTREPLLRSKMFLQKSTCQTKQGNRFYEAKCFFRNPHSECRLRRCMSDLWRCKGY